MSRRHAQVGPSIYQSSIDFLISLIREGAAISGMHACFGGALAVAAFGGNLIEIAGLEQKCMGRAPHQVLIAWTRSTDQMPTVESIDGGRPQSRRVKWQTMPRHFEFDRSRWVGNREPMDAASIQTRRRRPRPSPTHTYIYIRNRTAAGVTRVGTMDRRR